MGVKKIVTELMKQDGDLDTIFYSEQSDEIKVTDKSQQEPSKFGELFVNWPHSEDADKHLAHETCYVAIRIAEFIFNNQRQPTYEEQVDFGFDFTQKLILAGFFQHENFAIKHVNIVFNDLIEHIKDFSGADVADLSYIDYDGYFEYLDKVAQCIESNEHFSQCLLDELIHKINVKIGAQELHVVRNDDAVNLTIH